MKELLRYDYQKIRSLIESGEISCYELTQVYCNQIAAQEKHINAYITQTLEQALKTAQVREKNKEEGLEKQPLFAMPMGIKDMFCTEGVRTTAGSKILENFIPPYSSTVVSALERDGIIMLGKCNQDEFAMGSSNESSYFGLCRNPWNPEYVPGGSSGGSAAAVAAGMALCTMGTDTGGSIRQPASFTGVVGVKPTYGRVSRYGIVAFASSLDQAGPIARSVADAALILDSICGYDEKDSTTARRDATQFFSLLTSDIKGVRVGVSDALFEGVDDDVKAEVLRAIATLKDNGNEIIDISLPHMSYAVPVYYLVAASEASSNLARYDGVRFGYRSDFREKPAENLEEFYARTRGEGFGSEVKRRVMLGTYSLSSGYYDAHYKKASQVRRLIQEDYIKAFASCDVVVGPVSTSPAFKIGEKVADPLAMYQNDLLTTATNLAGIPGLSVPIGYTAKGLPVGLHINAKHFEEQKMLNVAKFIEDFHCKEERWPSVLQ